MKISLENLKIAVALRTGRTALGWGQQELADSADVAKSTIARIETLEMAAKADFLTRVLRLYQEHGVTVDLLQADKVSFTVGIEAFKEARSRLENEAMRRSDRRNGRNLNARVHDPELTTHIVRQKKQK